jgi:ApaG protein
MIEKSEKSAIPFSQLKMRRHSGPPLALTLDETSGLRQSRGMYQSVTHAIQVTVLPEFVADQSDPDERRFVWAYTIEIANLGRHTVQLVERYWQITDAAGRLEEVRGPGVIGEQPILNPGDSFRYTSGCHLTTPSGIMAGNYTMVDEAGRRFTIEIPAFSLDSPHGRRVLN